MEDFTFSYKRFIILLGLFIAPIFMLESEEELQEKMCFLIILITDPRTYTNTINNRKDIKISLKNPPP